MPCVQEGAAAEAATTATAAPTAPAPRQQQGRDCKTRAKKQESNTATSRSDHDVGRRCRSNVIFTRSNLPCACKAALFIAEALRGCAAEELDIFVLDVPLWRHTIAACPLLRSYLGHLGLWSLGGLRILDPWVLLSLLHTNAPVLPHLIDRRLTLLPKHLFPN